MGIEQKGCEKLQSSAGIPQSVKNGQKIFSLLKKLGTTDRDVALARRNLHRNLHDPNTMAQINQGIEEQREHFDNLGLHIGYIYGDTRIPYNASIYRPICIPGARLPHAWIQPLAASTIDLPAIDSSYVVDLSPKQIEQKQYSTLDICAFDGFTILTDVRHTSIWEQHVQGLYQKIPAAVAESLAIRMVVLGRDFHLVPGEHSQLWVEIMRLHEGQATLVRPDQHILSCFDSATTRVTDLLHALHDHLQWPTQQYANVRL
ncbi:hypothetical protein BDV40DRAFT_308867 [Aspergillus tamarii]|uniref:Uncharacterized protein n=1 Tax=Aspergillus tamarii TaxID=41984 RepID=A0A5N6UFE0_ASPTM|nr:hypothetical protein BDV40DRAFT_308867 [Aspergillus tamarii]